RSCCPKADCPYSDRVRAFVRPPCKHPSPERTRTHSFGDQDPGLCETNARTRMRPSQGKVVREQCRNTKSRGRLSAWKASPPSIGVSPPREQLAAVPRSARKPGLPPVAG